jgi:hypothetical protein
MYLGSSDTRTILLSLPEWFVVLRQHIILNYVILQRKSSIYIYKNGCMFVCVFVCSGITLERLERFRSNLVHMWLYVCARILCIYSYYISILSPKHHFQQGGWCGRPRWDPPPLGVTNRCRSNVYANRYRSNGPICGNVYANRCRSNSPIVCVVLEHTYKHASNCI